MAWRMTNKEKWYDKQATKQFRRKYGKKKNKKCKRHKKRFGTVVKKEDNIPCEGLSGCDTARFRTFSGKALCHRCFMAFVHGKKKPKTTQPSQKSEIEQLRVDIEKERRKLIFSKWKDPELDVFRKTEEYQKWRIAVLERDSYTCQHCERTGGQLHVHHIKTAKMHKNIRLEMKNGIVLCKECHANLHIKRYDKWAKIAKIG